MSPNKTSLIITVFNEEKSVGKLIDSIAHQSRLPDEIIISDGGSQDNTIREINKTTKRFPKLNIKVIVKKGNRSVGRNEAIKKAQGEIILSTDTGCILDKHWVENITKPFANKNVDVVAGYYKGLSDNVFQKSLIPYVLVMPDKVNEKEFLPATRSMAFRKSVWEKVRGFDEKLSHNEDYAFANKLKSVNAQIVFAKDAVVGWIPRENLKQAFIMFFRFALGDIQAKLYRDKVVYLFLRYIFAVYLVILSLIMKSVLLNSFLSLCFILYFIWSIFKNYKYVGHPKAFIYLPLFQFTSDIAVMLGTFFGLIQKLSIKSFFNLILNNKGVSAVILMYILTMLSTVNYGIPSQNHPFNYFMDEWHQSQSVRNLFTIGSPNVSGAANGSIFQFFLTGLYIIPFYILGIIDPFSIKSSVTQLDMQFRLFEVFRLNTILFGVFSIILISYIAKKYFKLNPFLAALLFTINPLWIMLSGYFKYDIALMFWILVSVLFFLRYLKSLSFTDFFFAGVFSALSLATKLSAIPLLLIYVITFFVFTPKFQDKFKYLFIGLFVYIGTFLLFGIPDILLGKGSLVEYLTSNLVGSPAGSYNYNLGMNYFQYLLLKLFPSNFGHAFYFLFFVSLIIGLIMFLVKIKNFKNIRNILIQNKNYIFLTIFFGLFALSLYPLKLGAGGNRVLVILPFIVITTLLFISKILSYKNLVIKFLIAGIISLIIVFQAFETFTWVKFKIDPDPRMVSSNWIQENIKSGMVIGIENIPIYQRLPDVIVKEFYYTQYKITNNNIFQYQVISSKTKTLPKIIVLTNDDIEYRYLVKSDKKELVKRLRSENYKVIAKFKPDFKYFKFFGKELDFYMSGIILTPDTISVYEK